MATLSFVKGWPNYRIPYVIDAFKDDVLKAIGQVNSKTMFKFIPRTTEDDYVVFKVGNDTASNPNWKPPVPTSDSLGYCPGITTVGLKEGKGFLALHEIGHVIGLIHEHQRSDRNKYVKVSDGCLNNDNFRIYLDSLNQGLPYNASSPMHYGLSWGGCGGMEWVAKNPKPESQWSNLTDDDIRAINNIHPI